MIIRNVCVQRIETYGLFIQKEGSDMPKSKEINPERMCRGKSETENILKTGVIDLELMSEKNNCFSF